MWVLSWEVGCNGRRMALKLVGLIILVSMVTNHSHQTLPNHNRTNTTVLGIVWGVQCCDVHGGRVSVMAAFWI